MELINSSNRQLTVTSNDPRCMAIASRYGDMLQFAQTWSPANIAKIAENVDKSVEADVPALVMMMRTYGKDNIVNNLQLMIVGMVAQMGATNVNPKDIETIARLITEAKSLRLLNYAFLVTFFAKVMQGEYELYSCKPHQFMSALQKFAKDALARQDALLSEKRRKENERHAAEAAENTMTWEEYAKQNGLPNITLSEYLAQWQAQNR